MNRLPTLFLSHGSPLHALGGSDVAAAWARVAGELPRPRAVLMISAHWASALPLVTGGKRLSTIHDFGGFPRELYQQRYDAPGDPALARQVVGLLKVAGYAAGIDGCRGIDHGAWVPLRWMYPAVDVPVVQLSVQPDRGIAHHRRLGAALRPLADDGVLVVGSGHVTHNLRDWFSARDDAAPLPYVSAFAGWLEATLAAHDAAAIDDYRQRAPDAARAHPTEEHFDPLPVAWAAAGELPAAVRFYTGCEGNALALDAYRFH